MSLIKDDEMEAFYLWYGRVPVVNMLTDKDTEAERFVNDILKNNAVKYFDLTGDDDSVKAANVSAALVASKTAYEVILRDQVTVAFNKFDADGSGAIDKEELGELSKELGQELTDDELVTALKSLDVNQDGVIDL